MSTRWKWTDADEIERVRQALARAFRTGNVLEVGIIAEDKAARDDVWRITVTIAGKPIEDPDPDKLPYTELEAMQTRLTERLQMVELEMLRRTSVTQDELGEGTK